MTAPPAGTGASATLERIQTALEGLDFRTRAERDRMTCVVVEPAALRGVLERLRDQAGFESITFVTAVDHHPRRPRFEIVHQMRSLAHGDRVRVVTTFAGDAPSVPTCIDLWPGARYMERECFDMFGVAFEGHEDLARLYMPDGYEHHPLRKEFPHRGIEPDRLYRQWDATRRAEWKKEEA